MTDEIVGSTRQFSTINASSSGKALTEGELNDFSDMSVHAAALASSIKHLDLHNGSGRCFFQQLVQLSRQSPAICVELVNKQYAEIDIIEASHNVLRVDTALSSAPEKSHHE